MLSLRAVSKSFGGLRAVRDVSFDVAARSIFGLIGPNGAGKTTVFNLVTGVYAPDAGEIRFGDHQLGRLAPAAIAAAGVARTFQNIRLFGQLTVLENLLVAAGGRRGVFRTARSVAAESAAVERARELLRVFDLERVASSSPTSLPYGNQRRLEIARALMARPKLLLLDEPAAGLNHDEADGLTTQIRWLRDTFDVAIVLVEHNMNVVMGVCERIGVLDHGESIAEGAPDVIRADPRVVEAYLGGDPG